MNFLDSLMDFAVDMKTWFNHIHLLPLILGTPANWFGGNLWLLNQEAMKWVLLNIIFHQ